MTTMTTMTSRTMTDPTRPMLDCRHALETRLLSLPDEAVSSSTLCLWCLWWLNTPQAATRRDMAAACRRHIAAFERQSGATP